MDQLRSWPYRGYVGLEYRPLGASRESVLQAAQLLGADNRQRDCPGRLAAGLDLLTGEPQWPLEPLLGEQLPQLLGSAHQSSISIVCRPSQTKCWP